MSDELKRNGRKAGRDDVELAGEALAAWDRLQVEPIDDLSLAAYLDGIINQDERERLEGRLAGDPDALALLRAAREALAASESEMPASLVGRLSDMVPARPRKRPAPAARGLRDWIETLVGALAPLPRPLAAGLAGLALILCSTTGFELGRTAYANVALNAPQAEEPGDALLDGYPDLL